MGAFCLSRAPYTSRLHRPIQLVSDRLFARETAVTHRIKSVRNSNIFGELLSTYFFRIVASVFVLFVYQILLTGNL